MERVFARNQGLTFGVIAPDPSPEITETPAFSLRTCGMNSCFAWTVFRVTMSFYGVAHDRLLLKPSESWRIAIGDPCHRLDGVRAGRGRPSNRCLVHRVRLGLDVLQPQRETLAQSTTEVIQTILAPTR